MPSYSAIKSSMNELRERIFPIYNEIFMPEVSSLQQHIYDVGTIILRTKSKFFTEFLNEAYGASIPLRVKELPFLTRSKGKFFIHKNFVVYGDSSYIRYMRDTIVPSRDIQKATLAPSYTKAAQFAKIPAKAVQWADLGSIAKTLRKKQEISIYDYYMNYACPKNKYTTNDLAKFARKLSDLFLPMGLGIAETYEQMTEMYENGPSSCMKTSG